MTARKFLQIKFIVGILCVGCIVAMALSGQFLTSHDPEEQNLISSLLPPFDWEEGYIFGTDQLGRDIFARMVSGARVSLMIAASVVLISGVAGVLIGSASGFFGGWRDVVLQKIVETFWAFPPILLAIAIVSLFGQNLPNLIIALTIYGVAIMTRSVTDGLDSVDPATRSAAIAVGFGPWRRFWTVDLPLAGPVLLAGLRVTATSTISSASSTSSRPSPSHRSDRPPRRSPRSPGRCHVCRPASTVTR